MAGALWQKLLLCIEITLSMAAATMIQCPSNCYCLSYDIVTCHLQTVMDYTAVAKLSDKTRTLRLVITGSFRETDTDFSNMGVLENLTLVADRKYSSYDEAAVDDAVNSFKRRDLFQSLTNLRSLSIGLVLKAFDSALLTPLRQLKALSFSYTYMFYFDTFINIVSVTGKHLLRVEELRMIAVKRVVMPDTMIKMKEHIYQSLQNLTLKVLDLSNNSAVVLEPGLAMYLPHLEVFRVGASESMIFASFKYTVTCTMAEMVMHANIREFELSFPERKALKNTYSAGFVTINHLHVRDKVLSCLQHLHTNSTLCELIYCICEVLKETPCQPYGRQLHIADLIIPPVKGQPFGTCFPPPPSLEKFVYRNFPAPVVDHTINVCFNPSNWSNILLYADISYNNLKFWLSPKFAISGLPQLLYVNLQGNDILFSNESRMLGMPSVEVLLLGNNNISVISHSNLDFLHLENLTVLDLENCDIQSMPVHSLQMLGKLEILNLSRNILTEFEVNLANLEHLKLLNLSKNNISTLGEDIRHQLDTLRTTLDISGNPLTCFCNNIDFVQWLQSTHVQFVRKDATKCSHPSLHFVSPWEVDLTVLHRECIHFDEIISSVCSAVGMALTVTIIFVLYRRRWRIRYWIYIAKESWRQRREQGEHKPLLNQEYIYDAFVAYSSHGEERSWVHITLREKLENEHGLKLCMYHRDFKVGRDLADTIVEGINSSNKTLLILSPNFLKSCWCEFEVRMANEKVISERRDSLVIVIFKRLDEAGTRLPKMLSRLMEKKIYIEWTDDPDGQRLFWRRLVDSIKGGTSYDAFNDLCQING